jgi:hypothetical protein
MRHRPGVMAPPTLYDEPAQAGLMSPSAAAAPFEISLRDVLWSVVVVLAAVELCVQLALN